MPKRPNGELRPFVCRDNVEPQHSHRIQDGKQVVCAHGIKLDRC
jgi:hypothetical protein